MTDKLRDLAIKKYKVHEQMQMKLFDKLPELADDEEAYDKMLQKTDILTGAMMELRDFFNLTEKELK